MKAPNIEAEMNRDLEVVRECKDYILSEDMWWSTKHSACCETRKKYSIHASSRSLSEKEKEVSVEEVMGFPVMFQVRERKNHCGPDRDVHFGFFHPKAPDDPAWPEEIPLLYWRDPSM